MRYSRFKSAMLGLEPTRRNRAGPSKSRVTKPKKEMKSKKDQIMKHESALDRRASQEPSPETPGRKIKQESLENRLTPGLTPGPSTMTPSPMAASSTVATPCIIHPRMLTPSSESEMFSHTMMSSPVNDFVNPQAPFGLSQTPCPAPNDSPWSQSQPLFSHFGSHYLFDGLGTGCDHQHEHFGNQYASMKSGRDSLMDVKCETWEDGI